MAKSVFNKIQASFVSLRFVFSINKAYVFIVLLNELTGAIKIIPYMFLLKIAVALLTQESSFGSYVRNVLPILVSILLLEVITALLSKIRGRQKEKLDFKIKELIIEKNTTTDYYTLSTKEHFLLKNKALEAYNQGCVDKNLSLLVSTISNIVLLFGIIMTITNLGLVIIIPILLTILVRILSEYFDRNAYYIRLTQLAEVNRKSNYLHQICEHIRFAKEIRTFDLQDKFDHKLESVSEEKIQIWKKYMRIFRYSSATYDIADIGL